MIITCSKCKTSYDVKDKLNVGEEKKVRCSNCGEIWIVNSENTKVLPDVKNTSIDEYSSYINKPKKQDKKLEQEKEISVEQNKKEEKITVVEKPTVKKEAINEQKSEDNWQEKDKKEVKKEAKVLEENIDEIFSRFSIRRDRNSATYNPKQNKTNYLKIVNFFFFIVLLFSVVAFSFYYFRFDLVRKYPNMERLYNKAGVQSTYLGHGLEFVDVSKIEYDDGYFPQFIVTGFIFNNNNRAVEMPAINVSFFDENGKVFENIRYQNRTQIIEAGDAVQFDVSFDSPAVPIKHFEVTFVE